MMNLSKISLLLFICLSIDLCFSVKLNFKGFDGTDLVFLGDTELDSGSLSLTRENAFSYGRGLYINKIPTRFPNSSTLLPFRTSFTFSITPKQKNPIPGHGIAFIVVPEAGNDAGGPAGFLSFLNKTNNGKPENNAFAVEFDVVRDKKLKDLNDNHVGIDVNSVVSSVSEKAGFWSRVKKTGEKTEWVFTEVKLSSGNRIKVWIEYKNPRLTVTIAPENAKKPKRALIATKLDLSKVFLDEMYVGFSGAMGRGVERHQIWNWTFNNNA